MMLDHSLYFHKSLTTKGQETLPGVSIIMVLTFVTSGYLRRILVVNFMSSII